MLNSIYRILHYPVGTQLIFKEDPNWGVEGAANTSAPIKEIAIQLYGPNWNNLNNSESMVERRLSPLGFHTLSIVSGINTSTTYVALWPITLWKITYDNRGPDHVSASVVTAMDDKIPYLYRANMASCLLVASSESGTYSVVVMEQDQGLELCLLRWDIHPPAIHIRSLDVPQFINLADVKTLAIEERYGVIYLCLVQGPLKRIVGTRLSSWGGTTGSFGSVNYEEG
ncbi:hypothetical protein C0995_008368 [Termitomyces sp. Mi166|nr:hypothetical protein C0995_008368 [Termitomyces sp. Mi166\